MSTAMFRLGPASCTRSRYWPKPVHDGGPPGMNPREARIAASYGTTPEPQLPTTSVVTPASP
jgi:hypothetical protein